MRFFVQVILSALIITIASGASKRFAWFGALIVSLPLSSIIALLWLYLDTRDSAKVADLSMSIFWAVLPSLFFFICLTLLMRRGVHFGWSMAISCFGMTLAYAIYVAVLKRVGISV